MSEHRRAFPFRIEFPAELPISARAEDIVAAIEGNQVVILAGETGSGKTTQIPKFCLVAGRGTAGRIACTQPRRVAALSISRRVAEELGVEWGREVGCKVRFSDQTSSATLVKFLTDGMLLAEVQGDPMLRAYDTVIIDEAHERSLNIDFLLGHLRQLRYRRPELKIVITSATIDTQAFSEAFDGAPVIQVSGRTFPVETIYLPLDRFGSDFTEEEEDPAREAEEKQSARAEALHYVDGAVEAVRRIVDEGGPGDVLVFMPCERDIRETCELLEQGGGSGPKGLELVPLFGRLSNAEQQRVFAVSRRRKVVVATNIAETSLTIPGIRYVVDTGLSRLSRYSPQARTRRLPIEPVSQSSADQRKGRAGRVAEGVCIRLYSEKDYEERVRFTQPEIQRANLADVILRLKAFGLGDIERFPFLNPPAPKAIRAGYGMLEELGALEARGEGPEAGGEGGYVLTGIGRELARLPVDPTVGRMILQGRREKCLREVLVIAAGLSIQDPRERPLEKQAAADAAHRRFAHPDSDFLTLLNIWEAFHDEFERLSQARLRRFCKEHFLSYVRLREWRDIHQQLLEVLREREDFRMSSVHDGRGAFAARGEGRGARGEEEGVGEEKMLFGSSAYRVVHRCVLSGLLGNIACLDEETRAYKATNDRKVAIFPGSVLFQREDKRRQSADAKKASKPAKGPRWLMAAEIVETSRIYARTCARLDQRWILDLGAHLIRLSHSEPFYSEEGGRVLVRERARLYGLELDTRPVGYGRINPAHATDIFIREGLVNDTIRFPLDFIAENRRLRERIEFSLTRMRDTGYLNLDEAMYRFYAERLMPGVEARGEGIEARGAGLGARGEGLGARGEGRGGGVSSVAELVDLVRLKKMTEPKFLVAKAEDLRDPETLRHDELLFPANLPLVNSVIPLAYAYKPGQQDDGVSVEVNVREVGNLDESSLDWAVPGHLQEKVEHYLRALPKELRRALTPFSDTVPSVVKAVESLWRLRGGTHSLAVILGRHLKERFGFHFDAAVWDEKPLPEHLRVRVRVLDDEGRELCASRDLGEVKRLIEERQRKAAEEAAREDPRSWAQARQRCERAETRTWTFSDLPLRVSVGEQAGLEVHAFPSLVAGKDGVGVRLLRDEAEAERCTAAGLSRLLEYELSRDLVWLERDLRCLRELGPQATLIAPMDSLVADAYMLLRGVLCASGRVRVEREGVAGARIRAEDFRKAVEAARPELRDLPRKLLEQLREPVDLRQVLLSHPSPYAGLAGEVEALLPADFLRATPYERIAHLGRFLRARKLRADRWRQNPVKDQERARQIEPHARRAAALGRAHPYYWAVEEFRVSLFAQELGTSESVSTVRLEKLWQEAKGAGAKEPPSVANPLTAPSGTVAAVAQAAVVARKGAPVKSLGALDSLFGRKP